jgi:hypothetical protein
MGGWLTPLFALVQKVARAIHGAAHHWQRSQQNRDQLAAFMGGAPQQDACTITLCRP